MTISGARRAEHRRTVAKKTITGRRVTAGVAGAGVALGSVVAFPSLAEAAVNSIVVTNTSDAGAGSLRAALAAAAGTADSDQITFAPAVTGTITLTSGELDVTVSDTYGGIDVQGPGAGSLTIDAGGQSRVFDIQKGGYYGSPTTSTATVSGLTLTGGAPTNSSYYYGTAPAPGGAIRSDGVALTLTDVVATDNTASSGGAVWVQGGDLDVTSSTLSGNHASRSGGGIHFYGLYGTPSTLTVTDSTLSGNRAKNDGGAIRSSGEAIVTGSTITDNTAKSDGRPSYYGGTDYYGDGGGISATTLTLADSTIRGNEAGSRGGGLEVQGLSTITRSTVAANVAESGGGIWAPELTVQSSTVSGNTASFAGGGVEISQFYGTPTGSWVTDSTIAGNSADSGGGVRLRGEGSLIVTGSTIADNVADSGGGVAKDFYYGSVSLKSTVVAGNQGADLQGGGFTLDRSWVQDPGSVTPADAGGSTLGADALLGSLGDNGGPTRTLLPAANSPLIDQGSAFGSGQDQRGKTRPVDAPAANAVDGTDIGAVELDASELAADPMIANQTRPEVFGIARVGETLTANSGTWTPSPDSTSYQWLRDGVPITGATANTYSPVAADLEAMLSVQVTASAADHVDSSALSEAVGPVTPVEGTPVVFTTEPSITGTPEVGSRLAIDRGETNPSNDVYYDFQWLRDGVPVAGADGSRYLLSTLDEGATITAEVTAHKDGWDSALTTTDPVGPVAANVADNELVVTNTNNSGAGSLRSAVALAASSDGDDLITFASSVSGTINLTTGALQASLYGGYYGGGDNGLEIRGPGAGTLSIDAGGLSGVLDLSGGPVTVSGVTVTGGQADQGGGIEMQNGPLTLDRVVVEGNSASYEGGGVFAEEGGVILRSTIADNSAAGDGGGVLTKQSSLHVAKSTISGNTAGAAGGGLRTDYYSDANVESSTIGHNTAPDGAGIAVGGGDVRLTNSVVGNNTGADLAATSYYGSFASEFSLVQDPGTAPVTDDGGSITGEDPLLGSLAANGGPTPTMLPTEGSPVIDQGKSFGASADQRGLTRPVDAPSLTNAADGADMGAVELQADELSDPAVTNTTEPTITGTLQVGETLTAGNGTWSPTPDSFTYQWLRDGVEISGATAATHVLVAADEGTEISVEVTAVKSGHTSGTATSDPVGPVEPEPAPVAFTTPPSVTGTTRVGETLTANRGVTDPTDATVTFVWLRNGTAITGATAGTYVLTPNDEGAQISVRATATKDGHESGTETSAAVGPVAPDEFDTTGTPTVGGTARVGETLTAGEGTWSPTPTSFAYQWLRNGSAISGATARTYQLVGADQGTRVSVRVTATRDGYRDTSAVSAQTALVAAEPAPVVENQSPPTITGTTRVGSTLQTDGGNWQPDDVTLAYQWLRAGTPIAGATDASYALVADDLGKAMSVRVTASKTGADPVSSTSAVTAAVQQGLLTMSTGPKVVGKMRVGKTLTARPNLEAVAPSVSGVTVKWFLNNKLVKSNTNKLKLKLVRGMRGKSVKVTFSYKPPAGYAALKKVVKLRGQIR